MTTLLQSAKMTVTGAPGTGSFNLGVAAPGGVTFANAGVVNGMAVIYAAYDGTIFEQGQGVYSNTSGLVLTRNTIALSSNNNQKVSFSANVIVYAVAIPDTAITAVQSAYLSINLNFNPAVGGLRMIGDLSNSTIANRVAFQTATLNGDTYVTAFPAGTSHLSAFSAESDPLGVNGWAAQLSIRGVVGEARIESVARGTAGVGFVTIFAGGAERARFTSAGLAVTGALSAAGALSTTGALTAGGALDITGASTLRSTLALTGRATLSGGATYGAGTASVAPIVLAPGTNLSAPVQGAIEFDGTNLFYTDATARRTIASQTYVQAQIGAITPGNQVANAVFAGPVSGAAALPTYRALVPADIPTLAIGKLTGVAALGANADITSLTGLTGTIVTTAQVAHQQTLGAGTIGTEARPFSVVRSGGSLTYLAVREALFALVDSTRGTGFSYDWNTLAIAGNISAAAATFTGALAANSVASSGGVTGASATFSGVLQANSATITGGLSANALTSSTSVTAGSGSFSGALSANSLASTTSLTAASISTTGNIVSSGGVVQGASFSTVGALTAASASISGSLAARDATLTNGLTISGGGSNVTGGLTADKLTSVNAPKAWVRFSATGVIIRSFNVSGVTHDTTGQYTITFATAMPDANYGWTLGCRRSGGVPSTQINVPETTAGGVTATSLKIYTVSGNSSADAECTVAIWY